MNLHEEQAKIQKAVNAALSGLQEDPWLARRVLAKAKGEKSVKRKTYTAMVLSIVMVLAAMGTACALSASQVADFFTRQMDRFIHTKYTAFRHDLTDISDLTTHGPIERRLSHDQSTRVS